MISNASSASKQYIDAVEDAIDSILSQLGALSVIDPVIAQNLQSRAVNRIAKLAIKDTRLQSTPEPIFDLNNLIEQTESDDDNSKPNIRNDGLADAEAKGRITFSRDALSRKIKSLEAKDDPALRAGLRKISILFLLENEGKPVRLSQLQTQMKSLGHVIEKDSLTADLNKYKSEAHNSLINAPNRGEYEITEEGRKELAALCKRFLA